MTSRFPWWRGSAGVFVLLTLGLVGCTTSPEIKSARYIETDMKLLKNKEPQRAALEFMNAVKANQE